MATSPDFFLHATQTKEKLMVEIVVLVGCVRLQQNWRSLAWQCNAGIHGENESSNFAQLQRSAHYRCLKLKYCLTSYHQITSKQRCLLKARGNISIPFLLLATWSFLLWLFQSHKVSVCQNCAKITRAIGAYDECCFNRRNAYKWCKRIYDFTHTHG